MKRYKIDWEHKSLHKVQNPDVTTLTEENLMHKELLKIQIEGSPLHDSIDDMEIQNMTANQIKIIFKQKRTTSKPPGTPQNWKQQYQSEYRTDTVDQLHHE